MAKKAGKEKSRTVAKDIMERRIGGASPYFQVRIRRKGQDDILGKFPYIPEQSTLPAEKRRKGMSRALALEEAIKWASTQRASLHFYGKPSVKVASEHTLRSWLLGWVRDALDRVDAHGNPLPHPNSPEALGNPLASLPIRKAAQNDKNLILDLIKKADEVAAKNKSMSVMDKRVVDLERADFTGPFGLITILTGRAKKGQTIKPPASPATKRRVLATLGSVWNHASEFWDMEIPRPWQGIIIRSEEKKKATRVLSAKEFIEVEKALAQAHPTTQAAIKFVRWTAARKSEMSKLRWEHFNWQEDPPTVTFEGTKTPRQGAYKERTIHLVPGAIEALEMVKPKGEGWPSKGIVFPSPTSPSKPISGYTVYQAMVRAVERAGLEHAHVHSLRHTRSTEIGATLTKAQGMKITGHTDERTFMRYTHLEESAAQALMEADKVRLAKANKAEQLQEVDVADLLKEALSTMSAEEKMKVIAKLMNS